ncbi:MAG: glycine cleavage system aminomethyltransferase GcvT [Planctomycetaceae bacterium]
MLRTACHDWHAAHGGRMVDFAGWQMPVQYTTIVEEHHAVRRAAGLFDIAHMGRLKFSGPDACACLDRLLTNDVTGMEVGRIRYSLVCNERGGILDDVLVYRFTEHYLLVVNASNRLKIIDWVEEHIGGCDVRFEDQTFDHFMCAIQGPRAIEILDPLVDSHHIDDTAYYWGSEGSVLNVPARVSRTGYTGEDGFEVIIPAEHGPRLWETLIDRGRAQGLLPTGLGCRDTLRLEAAMPLYGHEMDETIDPYTAGLGFGVKLNAGDFIGREALVAAKERKDRPKRVGLELAGRRIAREGALLFAGEQEIGKVTSGTFSPTLERPIAMGYVPAEFAAAGTAVEVDIRGKREQAKVVALPFYKRG